MRRLRAARAVVPVLMLSAIASAADRVEGLKAGCDDYLPKPYAFSEVLARLESLSRRADRARRTSVLRVADLELNISSQQATRAGRPPWISTTCAGAKIRPPARANAWARPA